MTSPSTSSKSLVRRYGTGVGLLVVAAFVGWVLIVMPPRLAETLDRVKQWGEGWFYAYLGILIVGGVLFGGATIWLVARLLWRTRKKRIRQELRDRSPSQLSEQQQRRELDDNLQTVEALASDERVENEVRTRVRGEADDIKAKQSSRELEIVAFGTISSGKSSLLNLLAGRDAFRTDPRGGTTTQRNEVRWPDNDAVRLVDTPGLAEVDGHEHVTIAAKGARDADLVLLVIDGPMRDHEFSLLRELSQMEKRCVICLNKADWFSVDDQQKLISQIQEQVSGLTAIEVVLVRAEPNTRMRIRQTADGQQVEEQVDQPADISQLSVWMMRTLKSEGDRLLMANLLMRSRGLVEHAREEVERSLDDQAWRIVDRYMWGAGGAAALSPLPVVDLLAGVAISTKLVVDLAKIYRQDVDMDVAMQLLAQLSKNLIGILGASLAVPTVATVASQVFKTVPGVGTLAGGLLQGLVQALVTRWIGAVFIEYFRDEMRRPEGGLAGLARRQWNRLTTVEELKKLVQQGHERLSTKESAS